MYIYNKVHERHAWSTERRPLTKIHGHLKKKSITLATQVTIIKARRPQTGGHKERNIAEPNLSTAFERAIQITM